MSVINTHEKRLSFAKKSARAWQNYFDARNLLPGINLSPEQIAVVMQEEDQMLINGSAGSGKSLTLLYKLLKVMEQENEPRRILYCSFNTTLIEDAKKRRDQSERYQELKGKHTLHMNTFHNIAADILKEIGFQNAEYMRVSLANLKSKEEQITRRTMALVRSFMSSPAHEALPTEQKLYKTHADSFLKDEILWMKANGIITEEAYLECERSGRGSNPRLTKEQRKTIFALYQEYQAFLKRDFHNHLDLEDYALLLLAHIEDIPESLKYDYIFVDEVQDLQAMQLKALVKLAKKSLIVSGDPKQRIYKRSPFSYRALGLFIEGRKTRNLNVNYRSTKQIMKLASSIQFMDEENDRRDDVQYVREGEKPIIAYCGTTVKQNKYIIGQIELLRKTEPNASIAVIHRHDSDSDAVRRCPVYSELQRHFHVITANDYGRHFDLNSVRKPIFYTDAYSIKGLEFDYVFVIHFDRQHYPNEKRLQELERLAGGRTGSNYEADEEQIRNDEKKLLYVSITRAKKRVWLTYTGEDFKKISPFVRDMYLSDFEAHGFNAKIYGKKE
ncbi:UvrD-helicase domain-containing protein [Ectobacillus antri]|uniref:DNA 3'-5' helicase n=1 Tax=Ectobacillus antri TaxID=2486280 RepID=A0ABT6H7G0_9BACI|nr:UvrD-helicase domain-containing protein [Ectobacillus antri]MDG4658200.1 UvrD-helicase domain-containing protein [Ectobacillus antri]MDG5755280.1 UvrD-helicase domain-containing protein [Ectobacillus antri]